MSMRFAKCLEEQQWNRLFFCQHHYYCFIDSSIIDTYFQVKVTNNIAIANNMDINMNFNMKIKLDTIGNMKTMMIVNCICSTVHYMLLLL